MWLFFAPVGISGTLRKRVVSVNSPPRRWRDIFVDCLRYFLKGFYLAEIFCFLIQYSYILYVFLFLSPFFQVKEINIPDVSEKLKSEISNTVEKNLNFSKNILLLSEDKIKEQLSSNTKLKSFALNKIYPKKIIIFAEERKPYVFLIHNGISYLVDNEGLIMGKATLEDLKERDFCFITTENQELIKIGDKLEKKIFQDAFLLLQVFQKFNPKIYKEISEINITNNEELKVFLKSGAEIRFGNTPTPARFARLEMFINHIGSLKNVVYVDLRFNKQIPYMTKKTENNS